MDKYLVGSRLASYCGALRGIVGALTPEAPFVGVGEVLWCMTGQWAHGLPHNLSHLAFCSVRYMDALHILSDAPEADSSVKETTI